MQLSDAMELVENTPRPYEKKNIVAAGFVILAKYGDDLDVAAEHDVIYAGQGDLEAMVAAMSEVDIRELASMGWFIDEHLDCWGHYV